MTSANAPRLHDLYVTQRLTAGEEHDVDRNPMSRIYPNEVKTRLNKVVARVSNLAMPFVEWGGTKEKYVSGVATWPANQYAFPPDLWAPQDHTAVWKDCNTAINNAVGPVRPSKKNKETGLRQRHTRNVVLLTKSSRLTSRCGDIWPWCTCAGIDKVGRKEAETGERWRRRLWPWQVGQRPPPRSGAPPPRPRSRQAHHPPPARRARQQPAVRRSGAGGLRVRPLSVPSTGPELVVVRDDTPEPTGPPAATHPHVDAHVGAGPSFVTSDSSGCTSTVSSVSTSTLSPTLSSDSSDDNPVA